MKNTRKWIGAVLLILTLLIFVWAAVVVASESCFFDLRQNLRERAGVTIENDRRSWNGKANGLVTFIKVEGDNVLFHFEIWDPESPRPNEVYEVWWGEGEYDCQLLYLPSGRSLNDSLQWIKLAWGSKVGLYEHGPDDPLFEEGVIITLTCPVCTIYLPIIRQS